MFCLAKVGFTINESDSLQLIWSDTSKPDSIRFEAIKQDYFTYDYEKLDSMLWLADYHLKLAEKNRNLREMIYSLNRSADVYYQKGNNDQAMSKYRHAERLAVEKGDSIVMALVWGNQGMIYESQFDYQSAINIYSKALKVFQNFKNLKGEGRMFNNLGTIYEVIGDYDLALEYFEKSLSISKIRGESDALEGISFLNVGKMHIFLQNNSLALENLRSGLKILKNGNFQYYESDVYFHLAKVFSQTQQADSALVYVNKSLTIDRKIKNDEKVLSGLLLKATLKYNEDIPEAEILGEDILSKLTSFTDNRVKLEVYRLLYNCYKEQKKFDKSLRMHEKYTLCKDSVNAHDNNLALIRESLKSQYEIKLFEKELQNEKIQSQLRLKQQRNIFALVSVSLVIMGLLLILFRTKTIKNRKMRDSLLAELETLKMHTNPALVEAAEVFELNRFNIESSIGRKLNETDWNVLSVLLENPMSQNKEIAEKVFKSVDGVGSSLRRMYVYFDVKEVKYKKIALLRLAVKLSRGR